jgi:hypothetical protein
MLLSWNVAPERLNSPWEKQIVQEKKIQRKKKVALFPRK